MNNQPSITAEEPMKKLLLDTYYKGLDGSGYSDFELAEDLAKIETVKQEAYRQGKSEGMSNHKVGDVVGQYEIVDRLPKTVNGKARSVKLLVKCQLCGEQLQRYSNKLRLRHRYCGAELTTEKKAKT